MAVISVVSAKHAPGATTLAVLLASAADPFTLPLVLEADPSGGDLAPRVGTLFDPGMLSLVSRARIERSGEGAGPGLVEQHCRPLSIAVGVVVGSLNPKHVESYVHDAPTLLGPLLQERSSLSIVDCGRWGPESTRAWAVASNLVLVAMRPTVESAEHVAVRLPDIETAAMVRPVVIGSGPLRAADVADIIERTVSWIPHDPATARAVCASSIGPEDLRATQLWLAAESVLADLVAVMAAGDTATPPRRG